MVTKQIIKKGDWLKFDNVLFKIYEYSPGATMIYMHQMIYKNGEYFEGEIYAFSTTFVNLYMKPYTPYEEEKTDDV